MLHRPSDDSLVRAWLLSRVTGRRVQGSATISTQNDSVKQFVAIDLLAFASEVFGLSVVMKGMFFSFTA